MRVAVIGPGALGCLFASRVAQAGMATWLVDYNADRAALLREQGILVEEDGRCVTSRPHMSAAPPPGLDLTIVLTKAHATCEVVLPPDGLVLTLQNGLGNAETLAEKCGPNRVLAGTTTEAVTWLAPGRVRHVARGRSVLGPWGAAPVQPALACLRAAGFDVESTDTPRQALWEKVIANAAINPLTALLDVTNGRLLEKPETRALMAALAAEAAAVAEAEGCRFADAPLAAVERICKMTDANVSSMLQDVRNGKRTEIEAISGEIVRRAQVRGLSASQTWVVYQLVRALERP